MSEPYGYCQDTCTSARLLPGPSWHPPRYNKWSLYKGPALPRRPVHAQGLPPLSTGYVQEIIDQLISGALPAALWLSGNRTLGLKRGPNGRYRLRQHATRRSGTYRARNVMRTRLCSRLKTRQRFDRRYDRLEEGQSRAQPKRNAASNRHELC